MNKTIEPPAFYLFETMYGSRAEGLRYLDRHLTRLAGSAHDLGFKFDILQARRDAQEFCSGLTPEVPHRVRLSLERSGQIRLQSTPIEPLKTEPVKILRAPEWGFLPRNSQDPFLLHKTSLRDDYDRSWKLAESHKAFDMLFCNERGELTEGGRSNVFLRIDGGICTPPLGSGLLPGIMRAVLLENSQFGAAERVLLFSDLERAEEIIICNSMRGVLRAVLG